MSAPLLDRLARRVTRREALAAGASAAVAGVLWGEVPGAHAAGSAGAGSCNKGCQWFAHQTASKAFETCRTTADSNIGSAAFNLGTSLLSPGAAVVLLSSVTSPVLGALAAKKEKGCYDEVVLRQKASAYDCLATPDCSGFNPSQPGGPCDTCTAGVGTCCADPLTVTGYSCCALGCGCGSDAGACHSGATPC